MEATAYYFPPLLDFGPWIREAKTQLAGQAPTEVDTIRSARGGDRAAFARLVEAHKQAVYAVAHRLLGPANAPDAAQEAFLRAYQRLATFDPSQPIRPWLLSIARHYCVDQLRRQGRQPRQVSEDAAEHVASEDTTPEAAMSTREDTARIAAALTTLPERHREALLLYHQDQLSYREVATALEVPIGTVMTWIHRARRALRAKLEEPA